MFPGRSGDPYKNLESIRIGDENDLTSDPLADHAPSSHEAIKAKQLADNAFMAQVRVLLTDEGRKYSCLLCGLTRNRRQLVRKHLMAVHAQPLNDKIIHTIEGNQQVFTCKICGKITYNKAGMDLHLVKHDDQGVKCEKCGHICKNQHGLLTHQVTCNNKPTFKINYDS